jgi:hypothetical protein
MMEKSMPITGMGFFFDVEQKRSGWLSPGQALGVLDKINTRKGIS